MTLKNQSELFNYLWKTRPHISELSGKPLLPKGHFQWHWQFAHILPKGSYPKWKLEAKNIVLCLPDEHTNQERYPKFKEMFDQGKREYYKEFYNKEF